MAHSHSVMESPGQMAGIAAIAAGVGALVAMLFTPRSGEEMRAGIKHKTVDMKDTIKDKLSSAKDSAKDMAEEGKDKAKDKADEIRRNGER